MHHTAMSLTELAALPFRPPERAGRRWRGVPHVELANALLVEAARRNWLLVDHLILTSADGRELLLTLRINVVDWKTLMVPDASDLFLTVRASHSRRKALAAYLGIEARDCIVWLERMAIKLIPADVQPVSVLLAEGIARWFVRASAGLTGAIQKLHQKKFGKEKAMALLLTAAKGHQSIRSLPPTRAAKLALNGTTDSSRTAWELLTAVAAEARHNPPLDAPEQVWKFKKLLEKGK